MNLFKVDNKLTQSCRNRTDIFYTVNIEQTLFTVITVTVCFAHIKYTFIRFKL